MPSPSRSRSTASRAVAVLVDAVVGDVDRAGPDRGVAVVAVRRVVEAVAVRVGLQRCAGHGRLAGGEDVDGVDRPAVGVVAAVDLLGEAVAGLDGVGARAGVVAVEAAAAVEPVAAAAADQRVRARGADQDVGAVATVEVLDVGEDVVALARRAVVGDAVDRQRQRLRRVASTVVIAGGIGTGTAVQDIVPEPAAEPVVARSAVEVVVAEGGAERRVSRERVVAFAAVDVIGQQTAAQLVAAGVALDLERDLEERRGDEVVAAAEVDDDLRRAARGNRPRCDPSAPSRTPRASARWAGSTGTRTRR